MRRAADAVVLAGAFSLLGGACSPAQEPAVRPPIATSPGNAPPSPGGLLHPDEPGVAAVRETAQQLGVAAGEIAIVRTRVVELDTSTCRGRLPADPAPDGITFGVEVTMQVGDQRHVAVVSPTATTYCGPVGRPTEPGATPPAP